MRLYPLSYYPKKPLRSHKPILSFGQDGEPSKPWELVCFGKPLFERTFVDFFGYSLWSILVSRNIFEAMEKFGDWAAWFVAGVVFPATVLKPYSRYATRKIKAAFDLPTTTSQAVSPLVSSETLGQTSFKSRIQNSVAQATHKVKTAFRLLTTETEASPLQIPLEMLEQSGFKTRLEDLLAKEALGDPEVLRQLTQFGLKSFEQLTPQLAHKVTLTKLLIVGADLLALATKGQTYAWVKNWAIAKLSGREGFSGKFGLASKDYLAQQAQQYQKNKHLKIMRSLIIGFSAALLFPFLLLGTIKAPSRKNPIISFLKDRLSAFNYSDIVYMSKWVLLWHNLFNWSLPTLMASRDRDEFRENLVKLATFDAFFFIGDDLISGVYAHCAQKALQHPLETPILKYTRWFKLPRLIRLEEVFQKVNGNTKTLAYRLARQSMFAGLIGTTLCLGITTPLLIQLYTKKNVTREQAQKTIPPRKPTTISYTPIPKNPIPVPFFRPYTPSIPLYTRPSPINMPPIAYYPYYMPQYRYQAPPNFVR